MFFDPIMIALARKRSGGSGGSTGGGGSTGVKAKDVNFYDYDGTLLHSYTVAEAQKLTELPALPEQKGLICQGWNWSLEDIKAHNRALNIGAMYITDDGTTRLYIHLEEGRTSPMVSARINGTMTVDWGDGTEPDVLKGKGLYANIETPNHEYAKPGDYVIRIAVDGEMLFAGSATTNGGSELLCNTQDYDFQNIEYSNAIRRVEIGNGVTYLDNYCFAHCGSLESVTIPQTVTSFKSQLLYKCAKLKYITIPCGVSSLSNSFCESFLQIVGFPNKITAIPTNVCGKSSYLRSVTFGNNVTKINSSAFGECSLLKYVTLPGTVTSVDGFYGCGGVRFYDFTRHTAVPTLLSSSTFTGIAADCEIRVPAALYDEWIAATNWSNYASNIVAV